MAKQCPSEKGWAQFGTLGAVEKVPVYLLNNVSKG
jgi:hypothetical protein